MGNIWSPQCWLNLTWTNTRTNTFTNQHYWKTVHLPQYLSKQKHIYDPLSTLSVLFIWDGPCFYCPLLSACSHTHTHARTHAHTHTHTRKGLFEVLRGMLTYDISDQEVLWGRTESFQSCLLLTETHYTRLHHEDTISLLFRKHNPKGNKSYKGNCFNICMRLKEEQIKIFLTFKRHSLPQNEKSDINKPAQSGRQNVTFQSRYIPRSQFSGFGKWMLLRGKSNRFDFTGI